MNYCLKPCVYCFSHPLPPPLSPSLPVPLLPFLSFPSPPPPPSPQFEYLRLCKSLYSLISANEVEHSVLSAMNRVLNKVMQEGEACYHEAQQRAHTLPQKATPPTDGAGRKKRQSLDEAKKSSEGKKQGSKHGEVEEEENTVEKLLESLDIEKGSCVAS